MQENWVWGRLEGLLFEASAFKKNNKNKSKKQASKKDRKKENALLKQVECNTWFSF